MPNKDIKYVTYDDEQKKMIKRMAKYYLHTKPCTQAMVAEKFGVTTKEVGKYFNISLPIISARLHHKVKKKALKNQQHILNR